MDIPSLCLVLAGTLAPDTAQRKAAEDTLRQVGGGRMGGWVGGSAAGALLLPPPPEAPACTCFWPPRARVSAVRPSDLWPLPAATPQHGALPGQVVNLLRVAAEESVDLAIRQAAAISFKNMVKHNWDVAEGARARVWVLCWVCACVGEG